MEQKKSKPMQVFIGSHDMLALAQTGVPIKVEIDLKPNFENNWKQKTCELVQLSELNDEKIERLCLIEILNRARMTLEDMPNSAQNCTVASYEHVRAKLRGILNEGLFTLKSPD